MEIYYYFKSSLFLLLSLFFINAVKAFTVGPPPLPIVCKTMSPQHHDYKAQGSESPYQLTIDRKKLDAGSSVVVNLATTDPKNIKLIGFYLQARDENDSPIGEFSPSIDTKVQNCGGIRANAAHHASGAVKKENVTIIWTAPRKYKGEIVFTATAMQNFVTYWVFVQSEPLQVNNKEVEAQIAVAQTIAATRTTRRPSVPLSIRTENLTNSVRNLVESITNIFNIRPQRLNSSGGTQSNNTASVNNELQSTNALVDSRCNHARVFNQWFCNLFRNSN